MSDELPRLNDRLPCPIARLDQSASGAWFRLREDNWREDLAAALALATVAVPEDRLVFLVADDQARLRLELALETARLEGRIEVRG